MTDVEMPSMAATSGSTKVWTSGVVGARGIGAVHAREIVLGGCAELLVAGRNPVSASEMANRLASQYAIPVHAAKDVAALAERKPDFVSVCSPTELHARHCQLLRGSGAFVLVEKPMLWQEGLRRSALMDLARELFDRAEGRLAVNHPTGLLGNNFTDASGWGGPLRRFTFRYRTRGKYHGRMIAVDLLPHALSLLLVLGARSGTDIGAPSRLKIREGSDSWVLEANFGSVKCAFEFAQDQALPGSDLSFSVNGIDVRREQESVGNGFKVFLAFDGKRIEVPNPMSHSIRRAIAAAREGKPIPGEAEFSVRIVELMAQLLLPRP